ncbi:hypothetical protein GCM10028798_03160 [Humibacter antri]
MLLAVLLNPPSSTTGVRTRNAVNLAGEVLGFHRTEIVNLTTVATPTVLELNQLSADVWLNARPDISEGLARASALLGGWGTAGLSGVARAARASQVEWLIHAAREVGIEEIWTVGGRPRHPSRWHQYVAEKHGRTSEGSFSQKLSQVMTRLPLDSATRIG